MFVCLFVYLSVNTINPEQLEVSSRNLIAAKWYQIQGWFVLTTYGNLPAPFPWYHRRSPRDTPSPKIGVIKRIKLNTAKKNITDTYGLYNVITRMSLTHHLTPRRINPIVAPVSPNCGYKNLTSKVKTALKPQQIPYGFV